MGLQTSIENVTRTEDGPYECYDAVVTAHDISQLYKTGFLKVDDDRQRGVDSVTGKRIIDDEKVEKWAEQLVTGEAYLGQLSWNFRKDETSLEPESPFWFKNGTDHTSIPLFADSVKQFSY